MAACLPKGRDVAESSRRVIGPTKRRRRDRAAPKLQYRPAYPKRQTKTKNACSHVEQTKSKLQYIMLSITFQLSKADVGIKEVNF